MFEGFEQRRIDADGVAINLRMGGSGPPLLLLHGYPQTHVMWHKVAPALAERFTVVCADLRGYGDSAKPKSDSSHSPYSKRAMAWDQVLVMAALGFERFAAAGHDRGARVVHRLCLDHREAVTRAAMLDIVPTLTMFAEMNKEVALGYWHWLFLAQPYDLPERMIAADPDWYLKGRLARWGQGLEYFDPEAIAEYCRCFADPEAIHASCEDYRAAATIDLEHDKADLARKIECPLLVLWGARGLLPRWFDVAATWRARARNVTARALDTGHFLAEEKPEETANALMEFFLV